jgi:hypothetical protein
VGWSAENGLGESSKIDLLSEAVAVFGEEGVRGYVSCQDIVCGKVSAVECEEELTEPCVFFYERVENGVQEELSEVVDCVGD